MSYNMRKGTGFQPVWSGPNKSQEVSFTTSNGEVEVVYNRQTGTTQIKSTGRDAYPRFSALAIYEISIFLQGLRVHIQTLLTSEEQDQTEKNTEEAPISAQGEERSE